jgi:hypothetical protein
VWELLLRVAEWLGTLARSPLSLEVRSLSMDEIKNRQGDSLVIISPYPRRYYAELSLTNRSGKTVYVKTIELRGPYGKLYRDPDQQPMKIEPGELKHYDAIFPLDDGEQPVTGNFAIVVRPAVGRKANRRAVLR